MNKILFMPAHKVRFSLHCTALQHNQLTPWQEMSYTEFYYSMTV